MKFALLGMDPDALELVRAVAESGEHRLVAVYDVVHPPAELLPLMAAADREDSWESLLHGTVADAVIVGRGGESLDREDQLRKLTQNRIPLLVAHPACSAILGYELEMIRRDTNGVVKDYFAGKSHPALSELAALASADPSQQLGQIEQVVIERSLAHRDAEGVLAQLARDAQRIRLILGRVTKVSAIGGAEGDVANLSVQMTSTGGAIARWSVAPALDLEEAVLQVIGTSGRARLIMPADTAQWQLQVRDQPLRTFPEWDGPRIALEDLVQRAQGDGTSDWLETCRDIEVAETAQRSARRGRTYELFYEEHKEEDTFKGLMAVGGCAVLLFGLLFWIVAGVVEGIYNAARPTSPETEQVEAIDQDARAEGPATGERPAPAAAADGRGSWLRYWPVCPFVLFLLLQLLWLVFRPVKSRQEAGDESREFKGGTS